MKEAEFQRRALLRLGLEPGLAAFRNNVGVAEFVTPAGKVMHVTYGLAPGSSDVIGCAAIMIRPEHVGKCFGRFFGIEFKKVGGHTDRERATKQRLFRELINNLGGYAVEAREDEDIRKFIYRVRVP